jgi:hypothetical protein
MGAPYFCSAHLHRRSVRARRVAIGHPEGVLHVARGMVRRNVQRVKVVLVGFDFRPVEHAKAHGGEELLDLV